MSKYFDFVERASSNSVRPTLVTNLIYGSTFIVAVLIGVVLYLKGWLFEFLILTAVLTLVGWLGFTLVYRMKNDTDNPLDVGSDAMIKPESYDERYHIKGFLKRISLVSGIALISLLLLVVTSVGDIPGILNIDETMSFVVFGVLVLIGALTLLASIFVFYQQWWKWRNWRIVGDPETGQIGFTQPDSPRWLFVIGSSTDYFNLNEYTLYTPNKSLAEFLLFKRSQMLGLLQGNVANASLTREDFKKEGGPPYYEDVKDVDRLIAIQRYWRGLAQQEQTHAISAIELQEDLVKVGKKQLDLSERQIRQNTTIIRLLAEQTGAKVTAEELSGDPEPKLDDTQVIDE